MYNGNSFTKMNSCIIDDAPADFWTFGNLEVTSDGKLYVASNHGLYVYNPAKSDFVCRCEGNIGAVMDYSPEGDLWFLHSGSIKRLTDREDVTRIYELPAGLDIRRNLVSLKCTGGKVYAYEGNDIMIYNSRTESFDCFIEVDDSYTVTDIVDSDEEILVLTMMDGLYKYDTDGKIIGEVDIRSGKNGAKGMYMDKAGMLWIASLSGLLLLDCETGASAL
jgi:ligand-binding sensor domain-containing protein